MRTRARNAGADVMNIERLSVVNLRNLLSKYIRDAVAFTRGARWDSTGAYLDGIKPDDLASAIEKVGALYVRKMTALRNAAPVVRGDTISITRNPAAGVAPNAPSREDEAFMALCCRQLLTRGFVLAADADTYEAIAKKYPDYAHPARVRGSEARRWIALHDPKLIAGKAKHALKRTLR